MRFFIHVTLLVVVLGLSGANGLFRMYDRPLWAMTPGWSGFHASDSLFADFFEDPWFAINSPWSHRISAQNRRSCQDRYGDLEHRWQSDNRLSQDALENSQEKPQEDMAGSPRLYEDARNERLHEEQARNQRLREEQARNQRLREEQARNQRLREEEARNQRLREEQARNERLREEQARNERLREEAMRVKMEEKVRHREKEARMERNREEEAKAQTRRQQREEERKVAKESYRQDSVQQHTVLTYDAKGYDPDDLSVVVRKGQIQVTGHHICSCDENCINREFARSYEMPQHISVSSLRATLDNQGQLKVAGSIRRRGDAITQTEVKVMGLGIPQKRSEESLRQCLNKKGGIKLKKVRKDTGLEVDQDYLFDHEVYHSSHVNEMDDDVSLEVEY